MKARPGREPYEQSGRLVRRKNVQADDLSIFQRGQVPAAGNQDQAPGSARQEWPDLLVACCIVQHKKRPLACEAMTPQPGTRLQSGRDLLRRHT